MLRPDGEYHGTHTVAVRAADPPHLHAFVNGLELDPATVEASLTLPHHNGRAEGVNTLNPQGGTLVWVEVDALVLISNVIIGR
ncbi:hypothetical protein [Streptomyces sp. ALB3]|uniref:hypothetical protein n=1 Tax=Streptomyces sp. ALB3 TaxID=3374278 RepID=UPI0037A6F840